VHPTFRKVIKNGLRMLEQIVIVGAGQAADQASHTLRRGGFTGRIALIGDEGWLPYQRPPLSKKFLAAALERERLFFRHARFYAEHSIDTYFGQRAREISRDARRVRLEDGTSLPYDALLLATGSRPRPLPVAGAELGGVHFLRTIGDVERIRADLRGSGRLAIVGGGYIGLEVAATMRESGMEVTVIEMGARVMNRVTCAEVSTFYEHEHVRRGVRVVCNARVRALAGDPRSRRVRAVLTEDGAEYPADTVIVGVGVSAVDELAIAAGLDCSNGVVVDEYCRTSDPAIYAAGDCTAHPSLHYGRRLRLESVDNAYEQGASAAHNLLGTPTVYDKVPWFWSDQYDLKLIIVGLSQDHDRAVLRGNRESRSFSVCYLRGGELIAVDCVNNPKDQMAARRLIAGRARPNLDRLADPRIPLKETA
jgi:3-phenylpropionate/trans-cinnamate dioxygenase ferredoxin reductase subunit